MYETVMRNVGTIMENYAFQDKFAGFGFGGIPEYLDSDEVNHCFYINKNPKDPMIDGLESLIKTYKNSLGEVKLWGPSFFSKILENQMKLVKATNQMKMDMYHILMILTDGVIHDMKESIDNIVKLCEYPISIIVIGIGDADFQNMEILDADDIDLVDSELKKARDIIQFVKYNDYAADIGLLAEKVLQEVPDQFVEYMLHNKIKPKDRKSRSDSGKERANKEKKKE